MTCRLGGAGGENRRGGARCLARTLSRKTRVSGFSEIRSWLLSLSTTAFAALPFYLVTFDWRGRGQLMVTTDVLLLADLRSDHI